MKTKPLHFGPIHSNHFRKSIRMKTRRSRNQQTHFSGIKFNTSSEFGGCLFGKGHAKKARPVSTKHAMHIVLRSVQAKGSWSLRTSKNIKLIDQTLRKLAAKYGIKVYKHAIVSNHIHLLIKVGNRFTFAPFMRALTGIIAMKVTGAKKLSSLKQSFWEFRPWSRIVEWGKAYSIAKGYVVQNEQEANGDIPYQRRNGKSKSRQLSSCSTSCNAS